jgi:ABC-type transport system involved in multi-copper enzyme maturation permease subunit
MWSAVFYLEFLRTGRRLLIHLARWGYGAWLLLMLLVGSAGAGRFAICCLPTCCMLPVESVATAAEMLIVQQFLLVLLVVPPFCAGAITEEKALGTLSELLMSSLTPWRIVVGKFLARTAQVGTVSLAGVPLLCWFGGLDWVSLMAVLVAQVGVISCLGAVSILTSVWVRTTGSAVLAAYGAAGGLFAAVRYLEGPFVYLDPFYLIQPAMADRQPEALGGRILLSGLAWTGLTMGCLALAAWRLRPAYIRQFLDRGGREKALRRAWWRPRIGTDPLRWKERHIEALSPLPFLRLLPRWAGVATAALAGVLISTTNLARNLPPDVTLGGLTDALLRQDFAAVADALDRSQSSALAFLLQGLLSLLFLTIVVNLRAAGGISGEREKGTWDALLLAGMKARDMVRGKLMGILDATLPYLVAYGIPTLLCSAAGGGLAVAATLGTLGLGWPLMYLSAAVALERSTRYPSPWKSTADSLIVTMLLLAGLVYGSVGILVGPVMGLMIPVRGPGSTPVAAYVFVFVLASIMALFLGWLLCRVARDYIRGAALAIKQGKGDLPEKRYTLQFPVPKKQKRRRRDEDEDDELPPMKTRKKKKEDDNIDKEPPINKRQQPDEDDNIREELPPE